MIRWHDQVTGSSNTIQEQDHVASRQQDQAADSQAAGPETDAEPAVQVSKRQRQVPSRFRWAGSGVFHCCRGTLQRDIIAAAAGSGALPGAGITADQGWKSGQRPEAGPRACQGARIAT